MMHYRRRDGNPISEKYRSSVVLYCLYVPLIRRATLARLRLELRTNLACLEMGAAAAVAPGVPLRRAEPPPPPRPAAAAALAGGAAASARGCRSCRRSNSRPTTWSASRSWTGHLLGPRRRELHRPGPLHLHARRAPAQLQAQQLLQLRQAAQHQYCRRRRPLSGHGRRRDR